MTATFETPEFICVVKLSLDVNFISPLIFAETFSVGRGVVDISVTSDASKEIINVGNEILRNF